MPDTPRLSVRRRRLSEELRRLRLAARMTLDDAAAATEWSVGKVSNIETGVRLRPSVVEVRALLDVYGLTDNQRREALFAITRQAGKKGWWTKYSDVFPDEFPVLESEATAISTYEPMIIPGLLQTPGYVELLTRSANLVRDPIDIQRVVDARLRRQEILTGQNSPELWAVIDAGAIERLRANPDVCREQASHLADMADNGDGVTIQVVPFSAGIHAGAKGSFVLMDFAAADPVVYLEMDQDGLFLEESDEVIRYRNLFNHLVSRSLDVDASVAYLRETAKAP
ncbi:transcriptional regulator [Nocardiopsis terrae]|uniref:Transcriptional regulator with XRE-family HTH domain n=1 Tax=Nocardiopsis terrae TaxID=372655 RepID=A0ABR9HCQ6_9ACTN|nr:helix-turn-helix transcriptional regulator [Nocardiopsis terrae]MBE1456814.1 transcriptional regulator with XRE-family HTH domain [Nocardiopsis terrae]GHC74983.1 transcriptional regulator [Nocardiopsis terrae]